MEIYELIIACAPALTAVVSIIIAVTTVIAKVKKLRGELKNINTVISTINAENIALKKELARVYKLHSEIIDHIYYKEDCADGEQHNA